MKENEFFTLIWCEAIQDVRIFGRGPGAPFEIWVFLKPQPAHLQPYHASMSQQLARVLMHGRRKEPRKFQLIESAVRLIGRCGWQGSIGLDMLDPEAIAPPRPPVAHQTAAAGMINLDHVLQACGQLNEDLHSMSKAALDDNFDQRAAALSEAAHLVKWYAGKLHQQVTIPIPLFSASAQSNHH